MNKAELGFKILEVLSPLLLAALTWLAAKIARLINAKVKNEYLRGVLERLNVAVLAAVREVHQVTVEELKAASTDGKLTPDERARVKQVAIEAVRSHLGKRGISELVKVLGLGNGNGAVDKLLATRIEAAVHDLKRARAIHMNGVNGPGAELPFAA